MTKPGNFLLWSTIVNLSTKKQTLLPGRFPSIGFKSHPRHYSRVPALPKDRTTMMCVPLTIIPWLDSNTGMPCPDLLSPVKDTVNHMPLRGSGINISRGKSREEKEIGR